METTCNPGTAARTIDWHAIQLAVETSDASIRAIARSHSITHTAIFKRARAGGWKRPDGSPRLGAESAVQRDEVKAVSKGGGLTAIGDDLMLEILGDVAGGMSVNMALKRAGVSPGTFYRTLASGSQWLEKYQRARASCMDAVADSLIELADEKPPLVMSGETGDPRVDPGWVTWQRNRIYARQWVLGRLAPRKYGDRLAAEVSGPVVGPIETVGINAVPEGVAAAMERIREVIRKAQETQNGDEAQESSHETSPAEQATADRTGAGIRDYPGDGSPEPPLRAQPRSRSPDRRASEQQRPCP